ncbi:unnamed protein product [Wuchereria bancrofti]|uniref:valine--tRNA ligase n=1 Tax=Wuchereria bancrofti TaxID=6293 RepID=A0A3P7EC78_WUCBA|nr:unnamed protein product [Wuchereria bancrofti]
MSFILFYYLLYCHCRELKRAKEGQAHDYPNGIPECGTDALRFALMNYTSQCRDINLDVLRIQGYRFFCNKIWQASRFTLMQLRNNFAPTEKFVLPGECSTLDRWILSRLSYAVESCNSGMCNYQFNRVTTALYNFWLYEFCDIYIEGCKPVLAGSGNPNGAEIVRKVLFECVETGLRLLSPFMPFITEELWQRLPSRISKEESESICVVAYPEAEQYAFRDETLENQVAHAMHIVRAVRSLRSDYGLTAKVKTERHWFAKLTISVYVAFENSSEVSLLTADKVEQLPSDSVQLVVSATCMISLPLEGIINVPKEIARLTDKEEKVIAQLQKLEETVSSPSYNKVPLGIRNNNAEKRALLLAESKHLKEAIIALENSLA